MNIKVTAFSLLIPLMLTSLASKAQTFNDENGIRYSVISNDPSNPTCEVGNNQNYYGWEEDPSYGYNNKVIIPATVSYDGLNYKVVSISNQAFSKNLSTRTSIGYQGSDRINLNFNVAYIDLSEAYNLETIGDHAFESQFGLTEIDFSGCKKLTSIGTDAFSFNNSLKRVDLSGCSLLETIGSYAFYGNYNMESVSFSNCSSLRTLSPYCFAGHYAKESDRIDKLKSVDFTGCSALEIIDEGAFYHKRHIEKINLSPCKSLRTIGQYAFYYCYYMASLNLSGCSNLEEINYRAFCNCFELSTINLKGLSSLKSIGSEAFASATAKLIDLSDCKNLESLGSKIFSGYQEVIVMGATVPPSDASTSALEPNNKNWKVERFKEYGSVYVPAEALSAYQADPTWTTYQPHLYPAGVVKKIDFERESFQMAVGDKSQPVQALLHNPNYPYPVPLQWSVSDPDLASIEVSEDTRTAWIKPLAAGTVTVTAKASVPGFPEHDTQSDCVIEILKDKVFIDNITLSYSELTLFREQKKTITASLSPSNATQPEFGWSTSDPSVATITVNEEGNCKIEGISAGECDIIATAKDGSKISAKCHVKVLPYKKDAQFIFQDYEYYIQVGETFQPVIVAYPNTSAVCPPEQMYNFEWKSTKPDVAEVDHQGNVTGLQAGRTATITATVESNEYDSETEKWVWITRSATCKVHVLDPDPIELAKFEEPEYDLYVGESFTPVMVAVPGAPVLPEEVEWTWTSSKPDILSVTEDGLVTGLTKNKSATIKATTVYNHVRVVVSCKVNVLTPEVKELKLVENAMTLYVDRGNRNIMVHHFPEEADTPDIFWDSSDESVVVATHNGEMQGKLKPVNEGKATIKVRVAGRPDICDTCEVTVYAATTSLDAVFGDGFNGTVDVFDLSGRTVLREAGRDDVAKLRSGIYIFVGNGKSEKVIVK